MTGQPWGELLSTEPSPESVGPLKGSRALSGTGIHQVGAEGSFCDQPVVRDVTHVEEEKEIQESWASATEIIGR